MSRYYGKIGYVKTAETSPGVYSEVITEYLRYGDILKNSWNSSSITNSTNDNFMISNRISVVAKQEMIQNVGYARYVEWMGVKYEITSVEVDAPRLIFTIGGLYNGN